MADTHTFNKSAPTELSAPMDELNTMGDEMCEFETEFDEIKKLAELTEDADTHEGLVSGEDGQQGTHTHSDPAQDDVDRRSIYVGNVDYSATPMEIQEHFKSCGAINRITIMIDQYTCHPKGYAYVEFKTEDGMNNSILLNNTLFKERRIKVIAKRKNIPGYAGSRGGYRGRLINSRGYRGGRYRGSYRSIYRPRGYRRGHGRPF